MKRRTLFSLIPVLGLSKEVKIPREVKPLEKGKQYVLKNYPDIAIINGKIVTRKDYVNNYTISN